MFTFNDSFTSTIVHNKLLRLPFQNNRSPSLSDVTLTNPGKLLVWLCSIYVYVNWANLQITREILVVVVGEYI